MNSKRMIIIIIIIIIIMRIFGNYFDVSNVAMHPKLYSQSGSMSSGDYDGDGKLDVLCGGASEVQVHFVLYRQNDSLAFYNVTNGVTFPEAIPPGFANGRIVFVDWNADGWLDFFYSC